jgi:hypothetical protein
MESLMKRKEELPAPAPGCDVSELETYVATLADRTLRYAADELVSRSYRDREQLLIDLANMREERGIEWFNQKWAPKLWPEMPHALTEARDDLRKVWQLSNAVRLKAITWRIGDAESHNPPELWANAILNKWLSWHPTADQLQAYEAEQSRRSEGKYETLGVDHYSGSRWILPSGYLPFSCWLPTRTLLPDIRSMRPMLIQGVFEHWGHLKYCVNPNCVSPYFVGKRTDQLVCDAEICKAERQREHARKWWNENRAKRGSERAKRPEDKTAKKGRKANVTRKTR